MRNGLGFFLDRLSLRRCVNVDNDEKQRPLHLLPTVWRRTDWPQDYGEIQTGGQGNGDHATPGLSDRRHGELDLAARELCVRIFRNKMGMRAGLLLAEEVKDELTLWDG